MGSEMCIRDRYDYASINYSLDNGEGGQEYPSKILCIYSNNCDATDLRVLVHTVKYKTPTGVESPLGDSRLVTHYRLEFENSGQPRLRSVPFGEVRRCLFAKEKMPYQDGAIPPRIASSRQRMKHTIMVVLPRSDWALLFIKWTKDIICLLYTSPSPRDLSTSRMPSSA